MCQYDEEGSLTRPVTRQKILIHWQKNSSVGRCSVSVGLGRVFHPEPKPDEGTFNGWKGTKSGGRIDWILASPTWRVAAAEILDRDFDGHYPSDHFPVTAILEGN